MYLYITLAFRSEALVSKKKMKKKKERKEGREGRRKGFRQYPSYCPS